MHLPGLLLDGFLERGWIKGSEIEACRIEYESFVKEQRQLERSSTMSCPDVGDVLSFGSLQAGFRARQHSLEVFIVNYKVRFSVRLGRKKIILFFPGVPAISSNCKGLVTSGERFIIYLEHVMICEDKMRGPLLCVQDFVRSPHFTHRNFFCDAGSAVLAESAAICDSTTSSAVFEPCSHVETLSCSQVGAEVCAFANQAVDRRWAVKDSQGQWYAVGGIRPSSEGSASRSGVRITIILEGRRVEYVPVGALFISIAGPSNLRVPSGKSKKGKISRSPVKRRFEVASPPPSSQQHRVIEALGFSAALERQQSCRKSRSSGRNRRAAPVFQCGLP